MVKERFFSVIYKVKVNKSNTVLVLHTRKFLYNYIKRKITYSVTTKKCTLEHCKPLFHVYYMVIADTA